MNFLSRPVTKLTRFSDATKLDNFTRSGRIFVPGSGTWWTNGLDGSGGSDFTL